MKVIGQKDLADFGVGGMQVFLPKQRFTFSGAIVPLVGDERNEHFGAIGDMLIDLAAAADTLAMSQNPQNTRGLSAGLDH